MAGRPRYQRPTYRLGQGLSWLGVVACLAAAPFTLGGSLIVLAILVLIFGMPNQVRCPHCKGRVKVGVAACRHCGRDITWT